MKEHPHYTAEYISRLATTPVKIGEKLEGLDRSEPTKVRYTPEYLTNIVQAPAPGIEKK